MDVTEAAAIMTDKATAQARNEVSAVLTELGGYAKVAVNDLKQLDGVVDLTTEDVCNAASQIGGIDHPAIRAFIAARVNSILRGMCDQLVPDNKAKVAKKA